MKPDQDHVDHIRATLRVCQASSVGACPCGDKANRVVWRSDAACRCYPIAAPDAGDIQRPATFLARMNALTGRTCSDLVDAHQIDREQSGDKNVLPASAVFYNGKRIGRGVFDTLQPKTGDVIAYTDAHGLHSFEVP